MANFYLDTEFIEDGRTIDLISIGMVADNGKMLHEFNKECILKNASDWVVQNVFRPIVENYHGEHHQSQFAHRDIKNILEGKNYSERERILMAMECFLDWHGKSRARIAELVQEFVAENNGSTLESAGQQNEWKPVFYAYYADYDWVAFCQLFGTMMQLPEGFPKYCRDLKQMLDEKAEQLARKLDNGATVQSVIEWNFTIQPDYPKQENEHDALDDAKWDQKLHQFILNL